MGEYATRISDGETVKIGTCESMYYLRADQRDQVAGGDLGSNPERDYWPHVRFRFPFPDEDHERPGEFHKHDYDRALRIDGEIPCPLDPADHYSVQMRNEHGYLCSIPCPETLPDREHIALADGDALKVHRNGFKGAVFLDEQRLKDGKTMSVLRCACGAKWRIETLAEAEHVLVALRSAADRVQRDSDMSARRNGEAERPDSHATFLHTVADRVAEGYASEREAD